jgi:hypothetical protein
MSDAQVSQAAKTLSLQRWAATRPTRLANELRERAAELPEAERQRLIAALQDHEEAEQRQQLIAVLQDQEEAERELIAALQDQEEPGR